MAGPRRDKDTNQSSMLRDRHRTDRRHVRRWFRCPGQPEQRLNSLHRQEIHRVPRQQSALELVRIQIRRLGPAPVGDLDPSAVLLAQRVQPPEHRVHRHRLPRARLEPCAHRADEPEPRRIGEGRPPPEFVLHHPAPQRGRAHDRWWRPRRPGPVHRFQRPCGVDAACASGVGRVVWPAEQRQDRRGRAPGLQRTPGQPGIRAGTSRMKERIARRVGGQVPSPPALDRLDQDVDACGIGAHVSEYRARVD
jgi:hypothetical protein